MWKLAAVLIALIVLAPAARADNSDIDFIAFLEKNGMGCGEGTFKCVSDSELIKVGHAVCYNIDTNGNTPHGAADELLNMGGWFNRSQSYALVAASIVSYCPWDENKLTQ